MAVKKTSAIKAVKDAVAKAGGRKKATTASTTKKTTSSRKPAATKSATGKRPASATTSAAKKGTAKKSQSAKKAAKKAPAKKAAAKKAPAKKSVAKKAPARKAPAKKAAAKKAAGKKASATKAATAPAKKAAATSAKTVAKKAPRKTSAQAAAGRLAVRDGERPWTPGQVADVRSTLESDRDRLVSEIQSAEEEIGHLLREGGEGAGNDQADVGSNTFERDHEMSMAKNAREQLALVQAALARIDDGTYGVCESCGKPVGKMRLQAFPRATLCMECKQRQERR